MAVAFARPDSLEGVFEELGDDEEAHLLAGGVSLVLLMNSGFLQPSKIVSLANIPGLNFVEVQDENVVLGAGCTHHGLATHPVVRERFPAVSEMFSLIGNVRVRMSGTLGGNLAHADPAQDPAGMLAVLGARVTVAGPDGSRVIAVEDLADGPMSPTLSQGEIITRIHVPSPSEQSRSSYIKFLSGTCDDYATVSIACRLEVDSSGLITDASLAAGAVGPTVVFLTEAARTLVGHRPEKDVLDTLESVVAGMVRPHADRRGSAEYKQLMTGVVAANAVRKAVSI